MGTMWCLCDPTPSDWCNTNAHFTNFGDQASNWLERLPTGSISTWEDLTARFLAQLFPSRMTIKLQNDILIFQQHQEDLALDDNENWNDLKDFAKPVKAISLPQDVPSTSECHLIELENQVQRLMEAQLAPKSSVQVYKIASSCEICSGPYDTQYSMKNPEHAFVDYAFSRLVSNFMAYQDAKLSMFEADFKQQQGEMTNKIDTLLKAINDRITISLLSDTVKILKLNDNSTSPVLSVRCYPTRDPQCSSQIYDLINAITICSKHPNKSHNDQPQGHDTTTEECKMSKEEGKEEKGDPNNINTNPPSPPDPSILFITEKVCKLNSFLESINLVP
nr:MAK10-like protein [Tanacetum cinerariifolium]